MRAPERRFSGAPAIIAPTTAAMSTMVPVLTGSRSRRFSAWLTTMPAGNAAAPAFATPTSRARSTWYCSLGWMPAATSRLFASW